MSGGRRCQSIPGLEVASSLTIIHYQWATSRRSSFCHGFICVGSIEQHGLCLSGTCTFSSQEVNASTLNEAVFTGRMIRLLSRALIGACILAIDSLKSIDLPAPSTSRSQFSCIKTRRLLCSKENSNFFMFISAFMDLRPSNLGRRPDKSIASCLPMWAKHTAIVCVPHCQLELT